MKPALQFQVAIIKSPRDVLLHLGVAIMLMSAAAVSTSAERGVISLGGGAATVGPASVEDTVGQPCVGRSSSANYAVDAGFWPDPGASPVPGEFALSTYRNIPGVFSSSKLLRAAQDEDGDAISLAAVSPASTNNGTVQWQSGQVTYTPPAGYTGADVFNYTLSDAGGETATGTVTVSVLSGNAISLNRVFGPIITNGNFVVRFAGLPGTTYTIEFTDTIIPVNWQKATNLTAPTTAGSYGRGVFQFSQSAAGVLTRYYRTVYPAY